MCEFISFWHKPLTGDIAVSNLNSHSETYATLKLDNCWREAHYTPDGVIELRFNPGEIKPELYEEHFRERFPTFTSFFNWAIMSCTKEGVFSGNLDLSGLTSVKDLVLPETVGGYLDLSGLTSAKDLVLPKTVDGYLDLRGLTSAKDLVLPETVGGYLDLSGLNDIDRKFIKEKYGK